jgi:hypothetical protein
MVTCQGPRDARTGLGRKRAARCRGAVVPNAGWLRAFHPMPMRSPPGAGTPDFGLEYIYMMQKRPKSPA